MCWINRFPNKSSLMALSLYGCSLSLNLLGILCKFWILWNFLSLCHGPVKEGTLLLQPKIKTFTCWLCSTAVLHLGYLDLIYCPIHFPCTASPPPSRSKKVLYPWIAGAPGISFGIGDGVMNTSWLTAKSRRVSALLWINQWRIKLNIYMLAWRYPQM